MTDVKPGDVVHFTRTGLSTPDGTGDSWSGRVRYMGESLTITQALLDVTTDRNGNCFFNLVDDEAAQLERWGVQYLARGAAPDDMKLGDDDHGQRFRAWQAQTEYARQISDPAERHAELKRIARDYADVQPVNRSQTIGIYSGE